MSYTVVILSGNPANLRQSIPASLKHNPCPIIVVADGDYANEWEGQGVRMVRGVQPFCFARNANIGIIAAGTDDVILLNDDAQLTSPRGWDRLQDAAKTYGIVSATIEGRCSNANQLAPTNANHTEPSRLAFICPYLPRQTLNLLGPFDESYEVGTYEDDDYCKRAIVAGLTLGVCGGCRVVHPKGDATFEKLAQYRAILATNKARYEAKYAPTRTLLSLCVASIYTRNHYLARLLANLGPQLVGQPVELLQAIDNGQASIGAKRQRLLEQARGEYVVSIDDDDLVSPTYIRQVLTAIYRNPADCITYKSKRWCDGIYEADCIYSLKNTANETKQINGTKTYLRFPYHVTPIKRELALRVGFQDLNHCEDTNFATAIKPTLKSEEFIDDFLYEYWWRSDRKGEVTHKVLTGHR